MRNALHRRIVGIGLAAGLFGLAAPAPALAWTLAESDQGLILSHRIGAIDFLFQCRDSHPGMLLFWVTGRDFGRIDTVTVQFETPGGGGGEVAVGVTSSTSGLSGALPLTENVTRHVQGGTVMRMAVAGETMTVVYEMVPREMVMGLARAFCGA